MISFATEYYIRWLQSKVKVVTNGQSCKAQVINAGISEGSLLGLALFLLYINNMPKSIL